MKRSLLATLTILLVLSTMPVMAQRWVERHSTQPDRDLDRVGFAGKITKIEGQVAFIQTDEGDMMRVHLGPRWFWHERGYRLRSGIHVEVSGWFDNDDESSCFAGYISGDGFHFELANSEGYPLWADPDNCYRDYRPRMSYFDSYYYHPPRHIPRWWQGPRYYNDRPRYWDRHWNRSPRYDRPGYPGHPGHPGYPGGQPGTPPSHRGGRRTN
jgi:hypothetical protein